MFLTDDHLHTVFSFDSQADPDEVCRQAMARGLFEITLTDHMDIYSDRPYSDVLDCKSWYACMEQLKSRYQGRLMIHTGIELGQPQNNPAQAAAFLEAYPLDFIIGSIHNIENDLDIYYCDYTSMDCKSFYAHYIEWLIELAKNYDFDVCGHVTYPSRYMFEQTKHMPDMSDFYEPFCRLFRMLAESGRGIELNLSGIARGGGSPMPPEELLKLYRQCGGEIMTIGSDAHVAGQVGSISRLGQDMLKAAGFKYITWFEERKPHFEVIE